MIKRAFAGSQCLLDDTPKYSVRLFRQTRIYTKTLRIFTNFLGKPRNYLHAVRTHTSIHTNYVHLHIYRYIRTYTHVHFYVHNYLNWFCVFCSYVVYLSELFPNPDILTVNFVHRPSRQMSIEYTNLGQRLHNHIPRSPIINLYTLRPIVTYTFE